MTTPAKRLVARVSDDSARMIQQDDLLDWIYKVTPQDLAADLLDARARIEELERVVDRLKAWRANAETVLDPMGFDAALAQGGRD